jgi:hypothetical protein
MESEANLKIEELNKEFQQLIEYVTDKGSQSRTAYEVELNLFRNLMKLGNDMLSLFFPKSSGPTYRACQSTRWYDIKVL